MARLALPYMCPISRHQPISMRLSILLAPPFQLLPLPIPIPSAHIEEHQQGARAFRAFRAITPLGCRPSAKAKEAADKVPLPSSIRDWPCDLREHWKTKQKKRSRSDPTTEQRSVENLGTAQALVLCQSSPPTPTLAK